MSFLNVKPLIFYFKGLDIFSSYEMVILKLMTNEKAMRVWYLVGDSDRRT